MGTFIALSILTAVFLIGVFSCMAVALKARQIAAEALRQRVPPAARVEAIELALSDLQERHGSLLTSFKRLQARVGMREARAAKAALETDENEEDDPQPNGADRQAERDALKRLLASKIHT